MIAPKQERVTATALNRMVTPNAAMESLFANKTNGRIVCVELSKVIFGFDVRIDTLIPERVDILTDVFRDKTKEVDAVVVEERGNGTYLPIDGRHRCEGARRAGHTTIRALVFKNLTPIERRLLGLYGNMNGALPPTKKEMRMNVYDLYVQGLDSKAIRIDLSYLPKPLLEKAIRHAERDYKDHQMAKALKACAAAERPDFALIAKQFGVTERKLRLKIRGRGQGRKREKDPTKIGGHISSEYVKHKAWVARQTSKMLDQLRDGDLESDDVGKLINRLKKHAASVVDQLHTVEIKFKNRQWENC